MGKKKVEENLGENPLKEEMKSSLTEAELVKLVEKVVADIVKSVARKEVEELAIKAGLEAAKRGLI